MQIVLNESEWENLQDSLLTRLKEIAIKTEAYVLINEKTKEYINNTIKNCLSEFKFEYQMDQTLRPLIKEHLEKSTILRDLIHDHFSSDSFKRLSIIALEYKIEQLKQELEKEKE